MFNGVSEASTSINMWYLNTQENSDCSGRLQSITIDHFSFKKMDGTLSVTVAVWEPSGTVDIYEIVSQMCGTDIIIIIKKIITGNHSSYSVLG